MTGKVIIAGNGLTTPVLKKVLDEAGLFQTDVLSSPARGRDFSAFKPEFSKYQVVVMNYNNSDDAVEWPPDVMQSFERFVQEGGGLVAVHSADNSVPRRGALTQPDDRRGGMGESEREVGTVLVFQRWQS